MSHTHITNLAGAMSLMSPETTAALNAILAYNRTWPDPRDHGHAEYTRTLQAEYERAGQEDGSYHAKRAIEFEGYAAKAARLALELPAHAAQYRSEAELHRHAAKSERALLAAALAKRARRIAA